jgi:hypothetical protein
MPAKRKRSTEKRVPSADNLGTSTSKSRKPQKKKPRVITKKKKDGNDLVLSSDLNSAKHQSIPGMLRTIGNELDPTTKKKKLFLVMVKAYEDAIAGDAPARSFIANRLEGKAVQRQMVQNIDVISKIVEVIERLVTDDDLMAQIIYEFDKLATMQESSLME